ncbi:MAG: pilin [Candidatus Paceibacterota bacterium]|jgi:hypothetical protein
MKKIFSSILISFILFTNLVVPVSVFAETNWQYEVKTLGTTRNNFKTLVDCQADQAVFNKAKAYTLGDCTAYTLTTSSNDPVLINNKNTQDQAIDVTPKINVAENNSIYKMLAPIGNITCMDSSGQDTKCISNDIGKYLNVIFKFAIGLCAALAVIMLIIAGVSYMGDESVFGKTEAKKKMFSAILGLVIALGAWALLNTINPALTGKGGLVIDTASVEIVPLYDRGYNDPKQANGESTRCAPVTNPSSPCTPDKLEKIFPGKGVQMSKICNMESSGRENLASGTDYCKPDGNSFSFGLFQVNLSANGALASTTGLDCSNLFNKAVVGADAIEPKYTSGYTCNLLPGKLDTYNACKARLLDTATNLAIAKSLFNNSKGMGNWNGDRKYCASAFQ